MGTESASTATLAAEAADDLDSIAGWAGLLVPYDQPSVDGRIIRRPSGGARVRDLPLELKYQESASCGHDGALIGLASITRVWEDESGLWGSGQFDMSDPRALALAKKVRDGFVGHVSVDLGDFSTARQPGAGGQVMEAVVDWKLLSTTIVADAAMDGARIYTITDTEQITPTSEVLAARRSSDGVFAANARCTLTFGSRRSGADSGVTLTITGAGNLPWAPREHKWDQAGARRRMAERCGGVDELDTSCYSRGFIFRDAGADPALVGSYSFPFADVIDGELKAVFRGLTAAAGRVDQAGITSADKEAVRSKIRSLYASAAKAFKDDSITAPFDAEETITMAADADLPADEGSMASETGEVMVEALIERLSPVLRDVIGEHLEPVLREIISDVLDETATEEIEPEDEPVDDEPGVIVPSLSASVLRMARAEGVRAVRRHAESMRGS